MVKKKEKREKTTLSEKEEEASNVSVQRHKGWIHVICVHDTTHLAVTTTQLLTIALELHPWRFELDFFQVGYLVVTSHFAAIPPSDVVCRHAHDFQCQGDAFGMTENTRFRAFITFRSQFHLHHCSQLNGSRVKKSPPTLDLSFKDE